MWYGPPLICEEPRPGPQLTPVLLLPDTARWPAKNMRYLHSLAPLPQPLEVKLIVTCTLESPVSEFAPDGSCSIVIDDDENAAPVDE